MPPAPANLRSLIDDLYRTEGRRVFATLVRLLGDLDLAEEAMHDAFAAAVESWRCEGVPSNPRAWLVSTARFKGIDTLRRRGRFDQFKSDVAARSGQVAEANARRGEEDIEDDRLRLIFTCCHPAIAPNVQVPLTLREVCGLTTGEIASAFLATEATIAQRIVRGKAKIRDAKIPSVIPTAAELPERLEAVLAVIYLVFNEGYAASTGQSLMRSALSGEAIRLGRLLLELLPDPEVIGLLALMLLQESRGPARSDADGEIILLEDQDRGLWNPSLIQEGLSLVERALATRRFGAYTLQAAIAAVHASSPTAAATDWRQIVGLYDALNVIHPSPVVELNRAVAVAMRDGPAAGLALIDAILKSGRLAHYHLAHAARAEMCRRLGQTQNARAAYESALADVHQDAERRFLQKRLAEL